MSDIINYSSPNSLTIDYGIFNARLKKLCGLHENSDIHKETLKILINEIGNGLIHQWNLYIKKDELKINSKCKKRIKDFIGE